ncbi:hypothetical protein POM88_031833 [Heracleum sosnowskyi]|uniref:Helitron helicase-like domain-containing protein n=1 Tax=Heracleum sosnowskyi TaxID=360622 RepID=A0AAD8I128_9APIA|nr:hypothetical protein POM88_031833 [Heracleum sosnowskyi]
MDHHGTVRSNKKEDYTVPSPLKKRARLNFSGNTVSPSITSDIPKKPGPYVLNCEIPQRSPLSNISNVCNDLFPRRCNIISNMSKVSSVMNNVKHFTSEDLNVGIRTEVPEERTRGAAGNYCSKSEVKPFTYEDLNVPLPVIIRKKAKNSGPETVTTADLDRRKGISVDTQAGLKRNLFVESTVADEHADSYKYFEIENSSIDRVDNIEDDFLCDDDSDEYVNLDSATFDEDYNNSGHIALDEYVSLGGPLFKCQHCQTFMWKEERVNKNVTRGKPQFSICCKKGQVKLPPSPPTPSYLWRLYDDPKISRHFKKFTRIYNSMFAITSSGGRVDNSINNGCSPYVYRLNGQNHHVFGSLIPDDGQTPKFCQLYIYDTENEIANRMKWVGADDGETVQAGIVEGLMNMLDETNELVQRFRVARDRFRESTIVDLKITLKVCRSESGRENHIGLSHEVAGIMVGDLEETEEGRDIIIEMKMGGFERVTSIHPKLMALHYPILFPNGEDGYHKDIYYCETVENNGKTRCKCSMKDFYSYKLHVRKFVVSNQIFVGKHKKEIFLWDLFRSDVRSGIPKAWTSSCAHANMA